MKKQVPASFLLQHPAHMLAFGFGSGLAPVAPGTFGTLAAVPLYLVLNQLPLPYYLLMLVLTFGLGIWVCEKAAEALGVHDHGGIVWYEFVGFWITMLVAPPGLQWVVVGFLLFRLFDVLKPFPINWLDRRVNGGLGIMLDDAVAGSFAWLCLQVLVRVV